MLGDSESPKHRFVPRRRILLQDDTAQMILGHLELICADLAQAMRVGPDIARLIEFAGCYPIGTLFEPRYLPGSLFELTLGLPKQALRIAVLPCTLPQTSTPATRPGPAQQVQDDRRNDD